jgi:hypothetical protein
MLRRVEIPLACALLAVFPAGCKTDTGTFSVLEGTKNGHPMFVMTNTSLRNFPSKGDFPWSLTISTPLVNPTRDGLTTDQEGSALNDWEDEMEEELAGNCRFVYVGRSTWNGTRELLYYVDRPDKVVPDLMKILESHRTRAFDVRSERDDQWQKAAAYLSPGH